MAETATGGNLFTRKIGPLPGWGWLLLVAAGGYLIIKHKAASKPAGTDTSGSDLPAGSSAAPPQLYSGNYSPIPPVVNITLTNPPVSTPSPTPIQGTAGGPLSHLIYPGTYYAPISASIIHPVTTSPLSPTNSTISQGDRLPVVRPA